MTLSLTFAGPDLPEEHVNGQIIQHPDGESPIALGFYSSDGFADSSAAYRIACNPG